MASFWYTEGLRQVMAGETDMNAADIRVRLVMSNTTADTEQDATTVGGFTTLDEYDGANYATKALANEAVAADNANNRAEFDADDITWTALGAGTRQAVGMVVVKFVDGTTGDIPLLFIDTGGFPFSGNGGNVTVQWNAEGIGQLAA